MSHPQTDPVLRARRTLHRSRQLALALFVAGGLLILLVTTHRAIAEELAPNALGSIAGVVRNAQGEPLAGMEVSIQKHSGALTHKTAADGSYRFPNLLTQVYRVQVRDPNNLYATAYYSAAATYLQGADIPIAGNQRTDIDLTLYPGGQITGIITATTESVEVQLYELTGEGPATYWQRRQSVGISPSGTYTFTMLQANTYRICAKGLGADFFIYACYANAPTLSRATDIVLTAGATISNVNLVVDGTLSEPQVTGCTPSTTPDPNAPIASNAQATMLPEAQKNLAIEKHLAATGQIVGVFTVLGQPAPDVGSNSRIVARQKTPTGWQAFRNGEIDPNTGAYRISDLPAGIYSVAAYSGFADDTRGYFYEGYYGGATEASAIEFPLTDGETKTIDIDLSGGAQFAGSLSGRITAGGAPLANAKVALYRTEPACCDPRPPLVYVFTDADGRYTINGLSNRFVRIGAADPAGIYATTYYTSARLSSLSAIRLVEDGKATTGIDIDLPLAGTLRGRITRCNGEPVGGLLVTIHYSDNLDPNQPAAIANTVRTDADGCYTVTGLHAGDYYVCANNQSYNNYLFACYGKPNFSLDNNPSARLNVVAGATTTADLLWGPELMMYLPMIKR